MSELDNELQHLREAEHRHFAASEVSSRWGEVRGSLRCPQAVVWANLGAKERWTCRARLPTLLGTFSITSGKYRLILCEFVPFIWDSVFSFLVVGCFCGENSYVETTVFGWLAPNFLLEKFQNKWNFILCYCSQRFGIKSLSLDG